MSQMFRNLVVVGLALGALHSFGADDVTEAQPRLSFFVLRNDGQTLCDKLQDKFEGAGYKEYRQGTEFCSAEARRADVIMAATYEAPAQDSKKGSPTKLYWSIEKRNPEVPTELKDMDDVVELLGSVNTMTTRAFHQFVPQKPGTESTVKVTSIPTPAKVDGSRDTVNGIVLQVKFK